MSDSPSWWKEMLTRRQASQRAAMVGVAIAGLGTAATSAGCNKDPDIESDARELQEQHGWNVGFDAETIDLSDTSRTDSLGNRDWEDRRTAEALLAATRPETQRWRSHESPALFQSLAQPTLAEVIEPIHNAEMDRAYGVAFAVAELVDASENPEKTMIIVDMPGAMAVAAAAGASTMSEPVFWLDNWPHPRGVVASQEPLAATLYYAAEFEQSRPVREALPTHSTIVVLDSNRLVPYTDATSQFDNRYMAELPSGEVLEQYGVDKVVYLTAAAVTEEADDLNEIFVEYNKRGMEVALLNCEQFGSVEIAGKDDEPATQRYYYGENQQTHGNFYRHHGFFLFLPMGGRRYNFGTPAQTRVRPNNYRPAARRTLFSSRTTGAAGGGVGRTRPTGFGRITHAAGRGGAVTNMRSGSFGRQAAGVSG